MAFLRQSCLITDSDELTVDWCYGNRWQAQTFTTISAYSITAVKLYAFKTGTVGNITVGIYPVDGTGKPDTTGAALTSGTYNGDLLPTGSSADDGVEFTVSLTAYALAAATKYAIVCTIVPNYPNEISFVQTADTDNPYAGGAHFYSTNAGVAWTEDTNDELIFKTYSAGFVSADSNVDKRMVFASLHEVWYGDAETPTLLAASVGGIDAETYSLSIFEAYGKAFIVNGTYKKVVDFTNVKITTTNVGTHPPDFGTELTSAGGAKMIVDYITSLTGACTIYGKRTTTTTFGAELVTGLDDDGNAISFTGTAEVAPDPPHWYNWTPFGNSATFGTMPSKVVAGCNWRGRTMVTKDEDNPHQWYMPRQGNPWDWNYVANDAGSPIAGGNSEQAGLIGDDVITVAALNKDYLIFICANSLWYAAGDPAEGGSILELDDTAGGLGDKCWCKDKAENLYIVATSGILRIPKNFGVPENLTEVDYPDFIKDLAYTPGTHTLVVAYDRKRHGINIFKTTIATGTNSCWWYDLRTGGLFPESYPSACGPYCAFYYEATDPDYTDLLFGCCDGYVRFADDTAKSDDSGASDTAIDSYITFGPIALNTPDKEGSLNSMNIVTAGGASGGSETDSSNVTFSGWTDLDADKVVEKLIANTSPQIAGTVTAPGRNRGSTIRRGVRGAYFGLRIGNSTADQTWGLEKIILNTKKGGKIK